MIVFTSRYEKIFVEDKAFASGGEGEIRMITASPSHYSVSCVKIYFKSKRTPELEQKIRFMVNNPPLKTEGSSFLLAWPIELIYDGEGFFLGFMMKKAPSDSEKLGMLTVPKLKKTYKSQWYKFDKDYDPNNALLSRLKLIYNIAYAINQLHSTGIYVIKDFKPDNVLVTPSGFITIVDLDSIQITSQNALLFKGTAATDNYIPMEFYNNGVGRDPNVPLEKSWDNFAIAEVFYQLLFCLNPFVVTPIYEGEDSNTIPYCIANNLFPFGKNKDKIKRFPELHNGFKGIDKRLQELFLRSFSDNPSNRPNIEEWGVITYDVVKQSHIKEPHSPSPDPDSEKNNSKVCPVCKRKVEKTANFCPFCRYSFKQIKKYKDKNNTLWIWYIIVLILIVLALWAFYNPTYDEIETPFPTDSTTEVEEPEVDTKGISENTEIQIQDSVINQVQGDKSVETENKYTRPVLPKLIDFFYEEEGWGYKVYTLKEDYDVIRMLKSKGFKKEGNNTYALMDNGNPILTITLKSKIIEPDIVVEDGEIEEISGGAWCKYSFKFADYNDLKSFMEQSHRFEMNPKTEMNSSGNTVEIEYLFI